MKTCSKCHRTFDDRVAFCLHDGMPLTAVAEPGAPPPGASATAGRDLSSEQTFVSSVHPARPAGAVPPGSSSGPIGAGAGGNPPGPRGAEAGARPRMRPAPVLQTGVLKTLPAPTSAAPRFNPLAPPSAPSPALRPGDSLSPNLGRRLELIPQLKPVLPAKPAAPTLGVKPMGESAHQLPPWELPGADLHDATGPKLEPAPLPPPIASVPVPPEEDHEAVITPDLPEPPQVRAEATPVGDETVLELQEDDTPELVLEPDAPPPPPPPPPPADVEVPLERRYTKKSAVPRASPTPLSPTPPVEDEGGDAGRMIYILSDDDPDPPKEGVDFDSDAELLNPYRPKPKAAVAASASADVTRKPLWLWAAIVLVVVAGIVGYLLLKGSGESSVGGGSGSGTATEVAPGSTTVVKLKPNGAGSPSVEAEGSNPPATPVLATPVPATPVPATPVPVTPVPATPVPAAPAPQPVLPAPKASAVPVQKPGAVVAPVSGTPKPVVKAEVPARTPVPRPVPPKVESVPVKTPPPAAPPPPAKVEGPIKLIIWANAVGADVFVDGQKVGTVPATVSLPQGPHAIKVAPKDKPTLERTVDVGKSAGPEGVQREKFTF